jgi:hypothetical protein
MAKGQTKSQITTMIEFGIAFMLGLLVGILLILPAWLNERKLRQDLEALLATKIRDIVVRREKR